MDLVIDTSAILAVLLDEPERSALIVATRGANLLVPGSVPWEVGNALIAAYRRRRLTARGVRDAWTSCARVPLQIVEVDVVGALGLAHQLGLYAYDAYILEAARGRRTPLLALDRKLRSAATSLGLELREVKG